MSSVLQKSISLKTNFKKIVEVLVFHEYYKNRNCNTVEFVPDPESSSMIRNYDLLFRQTAQGFVLLQNRDTKTTSPSFLGPVTFGFNMVFKDVLFLNLTKMPFQYNQLMSFTNENLNDDRLHEDSYVGEKDIKPYDGNGIAGKINLTLNQKDEFFGGETQSPDPYQYKIFFYARTFVLRYNFYFSSPQGDISKFYILNEKDGKRYENFTARKLENGMDVFSLELSDEIKLKEQFDFLFYLKKEDEFDKSFSKFLTHPEPKNLSFDAERNLFIIDLFNPLD
jgi:hypothetical protein